MSEWQDEEYTFRLDFPVLAAEARRTRQLGTPQIVLSGTGRLEMTTTTTDPRSVECPYCHAGAGEHCRTMNGNLTGKFGTRVNHYRREVAARRTAMDTCQLCHGSGWIPGVAWPVGPLDEEPCPECSTGNSQKRQEGP